MPWLLWLALGTRVSIEQLRRREDLHMAPDVIEDPASQLRLPGKLGVAVGGAGQLELREEVPKPSGSFAEVQADAEVQAGLVMETEAEASKALESVAVETGTEAALSAAEGAAAWTEHEAKMTMDEFNKNLDRVHKELVKHLDDLNRTLPEVKDKWWDHPVHRTVVGTYRAFQSVGRVGDVLMEMIAVPAAWLARQAGTSSQAVDIASGNAAKRMNTWSRNFLQAEEEGGLFSAMWHFIVTLVIIAFGLGVVKWYYSTGKRRASGERRSYLARRGSARPSVVVREPLIPQDAAAPN